MLILEFKEHVVTFQRLERVDIAFSLSLSAATRDPFGLRLVYLVFACPNRDSSPYKPQDIMIMLHPGSARRH